MKPAAPTLMEDLIPDAHEAGAFPIRLAAIDIGSNAIRFLAAEFTDPHTSEQLEQMRLPVRLGHDVFLTGRLTTDAMSAAVDGLKTFSRRMRELKIQHHRAVATSAVRDSRNGAELVQRTIEESGIAINTITGAEEARLVHLAVRSRLRLGRQKWLIADLGGGSLELSVVDDQGVQRIESHEIGSVRMLEELGIAGEEPGRFRRRLEEYTATLRSSRMLHAKVAGFIATGGNIEALARLSDAPTDGNGVATLNVSALRAAIERLARLSYAERIAQLQLRADRADVILPAALAYERVAVLAGVDSILVPNVGVKEGVLLDLLEQSTRSRRRRTTQDRALFSAAITLGRRFHFDEGHARHVAMLAGSLFDQTRPLHQLKGDERRLLIAAALLHDIGSFIGYKRHHKHSLYIISESELPGLTPTEILMVANVARYHRKNAPAAHHESLMRLDDKSRDRVARISAILRIADALDREHLQRVQSLTATVAGGVLELSAAGRGDFLLERWALQQKAQLFAKIFGVPVRLVNAED